MKWEYRFVDSEFSDSKWTKDQAPNLEQWLDNLNALGQEGWELMGEVHLFPVKEVNHPRYLLAKRQVPE
jgi:hypothetical protein